MKSLCNLLFPALFLAPLVTGAPAVQVVAGPQGGPAAATPLTPPRPGRIPASASAVAVIAAPGHYVLTHHVVGPSGLIGIEIRSRNVTLDLGGYTLFGRSGSLDGISIPHGVNDVRIVNGSIRGWGGDGIGAETSTAVEVVGVRVDGCGVDGISIGAGTVRHCRVQSCGANGVIAALDESIVKDTVVELCAGDGIRVESTSAVSGCVVSGSGFAGIRSGLACRIEDCVVEGSGIFGIGAQDGAAVVGCTTRGNGAAGISASRGTVVENCTASSNLIGIDVLEGTVRGCAVYSNTREGYSVGNPGSLLSGCTAGDNQGVGFDLGTGVVVSECTATSNGGHGFKAGADSMFRHCTAADNGDRGFLVGVSGLVKACVANGNTMGVEAGGETSVIDCVTEENRANGIRVDSDSLVRGNSTSDNVGSGIIATGLENRIDSNHLTEDDITLEASGNNTLVRNSADAYNLNPGATGFLAPIRTSLTAAGPWDNIQF